MKIFKTSLIILSALILFTSLTINKDKKKNKESELYSFKMKSLEGDEIDFSKYKGKVILIVNTASKCGFTSHYKGLEELNKKYADKGLVVLGFPCNQFLAQEPGTNEDIKAFCQANYGVSFQMFEKIDVNGENAAPLYNFLKMNAPFEGFKDKEMGERLSSILKKYSPEFLEGNEIKWNFTKFLVSKDGKTIKRFETPTTPKELEAEIESMLK